MSPQSGLKSIFHSTAPKSPRAPTPFRPPWARWGGGGERGEVRRPHPAALRVRGSPGLSAAEQRQKRLRKESLPNPRRAPVPLLRPLRLFLALYTRLSLRFPSQAIYPPPCLAAPPPTPTFHVFLLPPPSLQPQSWKRGSSAEWRPKQATALRGRGCGAGQSHSSRRFSLYIGDDWVFCWSKIPSGTRVQLDKHCLGLCSAATGGCHGEDRSRSKFQPCLGALRP